MISHFKIQMSEPHFKNSHCSNTDQNFQYQEETPLLPLEIKSNTNISLFPNGLFTKYGTCIIVSSFVLTFLVSYISLIYVIAVQADLGSISPKSAVVPGAKNDGWSIQFVAFPDTPTNFSNYPIVIENTFSNVIPLIAGAVVDITLTMIIPISYYDSKGRLYGNINCDMSGGILSLTIPQGSSKYFIQNTAKAYKYADGTIQYYPFDVYTGSYDINCYFTINQNVNDFTTDSYYPLNFILKYDASDIGLFKNNIAYTPETTSSCYDPQTNANRVCTTSESTITSTLTRAPINTVFPIVLTAILWCLVVSQVLVFWPLYTTVKIPELAYFVSTLILV